MYLHSWRIDDDDDEDDDDYWIGQSQPPAMTAYAAHKLPSCDRYTPLNMKLLKLNSICVINCTARKNVLKCGLLIFFYFLNFKNEFSRKEDSSVPTGWNL